MFASGNKFPWFFSQIQKFLAAVDTYCVSSMCFTVKSQVLFSSRHSYIINKHSICVMHTSTHSNDYEDWVITSLCGGVLQTTTLCQLCGFQEQSCTPMLDDYFRAAFSHIYTTLVGTVLTLSLISLNLLLISTLLVQLSKSMFPDNDYLPPPRQPSVECWHRVGEVPGSNPSQGPRHIKDVIKMVPVVLLFGTQH